MNESRYVETYAAWQRDRLNYWAEAAKEIDWIQAPQNILAGMPPGPHKVRIELVDGNYEVFPGQSKTETLTVAGPGSHRH